MISHLITSHISNKILKYRGFKIIKLGEIVKYKTKSNRKTDDESETGIYTFYTSSDKIKKCDFLDYKNELCIITGTDGKIIIYK